MKTKFLPFSEVESLAAKRQVLVNVSSESVDRTGDIVQQSGIDTRSFLQAGGTVLWQHDPDQPIGRALSMGVVGNKLRTAVQFPPQGVSAKADEIYGLIKNHIVNAASIGFRDVDSEPIDRSDPFGGRRYKAVELMEFSFVSVPAAPEANIIARAFRKGTPMSKRQLRTRPVLMSQHQRQAKFARLLQQSKAIGRQPVLRGDTASYAQAMARHLEAEVLLRAAATAGARLR